MCALFDFVFFGLFYVCMLAPGRYLAFFCLFYVRMSACQRLPSNCLRLPTNRHQLPTNRHRLPSHRHRRAYWTPSFFFFFSLRQPLVQAALPAYIRLLHSETAKWLMMPELFVAHAAVHIFVKGLQALLHDRDIPVFPDSATASHTWPISQVGSPPDPYMFRMFAQAERKETAQNLDRKRQEDRKSA